MYYGAFVYTAGELEVLHDLYALLPVFSCLSADFQLSFKHGYCIVAVGHTGDELRAHGLLIGFALKKGLLGATVAVEQFSEEVDLPAHCERKLIGP